MNFSEIITSSTANGLEIIRMKIGHYSIIIVHNPPSCFLDFNNLQFLSIFNRLILCGGFNAHHDMWDSSQNNTNRRVLVSLLDNHDYVILNSSSPTHFSLTGHRFWSLLDLTIVSNSIASNRSTTIRNNFLDSDHSIIHATVNGVHLQETQFLPRWNFAKANLPKFAEMCGRILLSFSPNLVISLVAIMVKFYYFYSKLRKCLLKM